MSESEILAWHDWFVTIAQAGATLAGLLFVGLTISLNHLLRAKGYLARGWTALALQFEMLVIGIFGLIPDQPAFALGAEFVFAGIAILAGILTFAHYFPEDARSGVPGSVGSRIVRKLLLFVATFCPMIAGASLIAGWRGALYWLIPAAIAAMYLSIGNAWVFAIEIPRRNEEQRRNSEP